MTKRQTLKFLIVVLLITQFYFFDLIPGLNGILGGVNSEASKRVELVLLLLMLLITIMPTIDSRPKTPKRMFFTVPVMFLLFLYVAVAKASSNYYQQSMLESLGNGYNYLLIFGYFPLSYFLSDVKNLGWFFGVLKKFAMFYVALQLIQGLFYKLTGQIFLNYPGWTLNNLGLLGRFTEGTEILTVTVVLVAVSPFVFKKKWDALDYLLMISVTLFHAWLSQGRVYLLITVGVIAVSSVLQMTKSRYFSVFKYLLYTLAAVVIFYVIQRLNFLGTGARATSFSMRKLSVDYFIDKIVLHGWTGIGFPDPIRYIGLLKGTPVVNVGGGYYNTNDIGLLGTAAIIGIGAFLFFGYIFIVMWVNVRPETKNAIIVSALYVLVSLTTLSPLDMPRVFVFSVILAVLDSLVNNVDSDLE